MALNLWKVAKGLFYTPQSAAPTSPLNGSTYFDAAVGKFQFRENGIWKGLGSGSSGINYITNPDGDTGTTGYTSYKDAASTIPVDGTGGTATHVTIAASSSSPLRGTNSLIIANSGGTSAQGEGVSSDFTIDSADMGQVLDVAFDYTISSGTFHPGFQTPTFDLSDLSMWVYDVTNSQLLAINPTVIAGAGPGKFRFHGQFQTNTNSTSYRLIWHVGTTTTTAWALKMDNVTVGPIGLSLGAPVTDFKPVTPNILGLGTGTMSINSASYRRVGDCLELIGGYEMATNGTGSVSMGVEIPFGLQIDNTKTNFVTFDTCGVGEASFSGNSIIIIRYSNATQVRFDQNDGSALTGSEISAGNAITYSIKVPIVGWASNVVMSEDTSSRIVAASYDGGSGTGGSGNRIFPTINKNYDTHAAYSQVTGIYTVPVSGIYQVSGQMSTSASGIVSVYIYKNNSPGTLVCRPQTNDQNPSFVGTVKCVAGDQIWLDTPAGALTYSDVQLQISRISGPETIAASEKVACFYYTAVSGTLSTTPAAIVMTNKSYDTHGAYNTTTGVFTAPKAGHYRVKAKLNASASSTNLGERVILGAANSTDGLSIQIGAFVYQSTVGGYRADTYGDITFYCQAGGTITLTINKSTTAISGTYNVGAGSDDSYVCIECTD